MGKPDDDGDGKVDGVVAGHKLLQGHLFDLNTEIMKTVHILRMKG